MRILVTGGAGFIGSHLVEQLLNKGHKVVVIDDLSNGKMNNLETFMSSYENISIVKGSILNRELVDKLMKDCDAVYHLAAVLGVKNTVENPLKVIDGCILGTRNILESAYLNKVKVIFSSTSEIYGKNDVLPFKEDSNRVLGPPQTNRWCYATAKALDEHICFAYSDMGLPVTIVRFFNTYGPRQTSSQYGGVIPKFIVAALNNEDITVYGDGTQTRCFTFINDTIDAILPCLDDSANGHVFNVGSNERISVYELACLIKKLTNSSSKIVKIPYDEAYGKGYEDMQDREPDISKARNMLNYSPSVNLTAGLTETINWYRNS
ncbi:MAG: GDP-mannose 4,6-dehydratase [Bacillota bacterium]